MYCAFYGIQEKPFSITPDPKYLYLGRTHKEAFAHLIYGIRERGGFIVITGDIGTGKTTLCRALLSHLDADTMVAFIFNPTLSSLELLQSINEDFGIPSPGGTQKELLDELNRFLLEKRQAGKNTVLIIDEAQNLQREVLENIRLLSNLETDTEKLLQIILIGQPEFRDMLEQPDLLQLNQRVTVRYHLKPLSFEETEAYVRHRLAVAGAQDKVRFSPGAFRSISRYTKGVPRLINVLCDRALLAGYTLGSKEIGAGIVAQAYREVTGEERLRRSGRVLGLLRRGLVPGLVLGLLVLVLVYGLNLLWLRGQDGLPLAKGPLSQAPGARQGRGPEQKAKDAAGVAVFPAVPSGSGTTAVRVVPEPSASPAGEAAAFEEESPAGARPGDGGDVGEERTDEGSSGARGATAQVESPEASMGEADAAGDGGSTPGLDPDAGSAEDFSGETEPAGEEPVGPVGDGLDALRSIFLLSLAGQGTGETLNQSFRAVVQRWGTVAGDPGPGLPANHAETSVTDIFRSAGLAGFECLRFQGNFNGIRVLDTPAVLHLNLGDKFGKRYIALLSLDGTDAEIAPPLQEGTVRVPVNLIQEHWYGTAYILWKDWSGGQAALSAPMQGETVKWAQRALQELGLLRASPTGVFDAATTEAVRRFQRDHNLDDDGILGPQTKICLFQSLGRHGMPALAGRGKDQEVVQP